MICRKCGLPIAEGEPRYTAGEFSDPPEHCHWECHQKVVDAWEQAKANFDQAHRRALCALDKLRRKIRG